MRPLDGRDPVMHERTEEPPVTVEGLALGSLLLGSFVPYVAMLALIYGWGDRSDTWWPALGFPLVLLAWICARPNGSLVDGCLVQIVLLIFAVTSLAVGVEALLLGAFCWVTWLLTSIESGTRLMRLLDEADRPPELGAPPASGSRREESVE